VEVETISSVMKLTMGAQMHVVERLQLPKIYPVEQRQLLNPW
jgi:hypothetical protein